MLCDLEAIDNSNIYSNKENINKKKECEKALEKKRTVSFLKTATLYTKFKKYRNASLEMKNKGYKYYYTVTDKIIDYSVIGYYCGGEVLCFKLQNKNKVCIIFEYANSAYNENKSIIKRSFDDNKYIHNYILKAKNKELHNFKYFYVINVKNLF